LIKISQLFREKCQKTAGEGIFLDSHCTDKNWYNSTVFCIALNADVWLK